MSVKERIITIRMIEHAKKNPELIHELGVMVTPEKVDNNCKPTATEDKQYEK